MAAIADIFGRPHTDVPEGRPKGGTPLGRQGGPAKGEVIVAAACRGPGIGARS